MSGLEQSGFELGCKNSLKKLRKLPGQKQRHSQVLWRLRTQVVVQRPSQLLGKATGCPDPKLQSSLLPFEHLPHVPRPETTESKAFPSSLPFMYFSFSHRTAELLELGETWQVCSLNRVSTAVKSVCLGLFQSHLENLQGFALQIPGWY